jgi:hypothetical protein
MTEWVDAPAGIPSLMHHGKHPRIVDDLVLVVMATLAVLAVLGLLAAAPAL